MPSGPLPDGSGGGGSFYPSTLVVTPSSPINLGSVAVGSSTQLTFTLRASGGNTGVSLNSAPISGVGFSIVSAPVLPYVIPAGHTTQITIQFSPGAIQGSYSGQLQLLWTSFGGASGTVTINLIVQAVSSGAGFPAFNPPILSFPNTAVGDDPTDETVIISNVGTAPFSILSLVLADGTNYALEYYPQPLIRTLTVPLRKAIKRAGSLVRYSNGITNLSWFRVERKRKAYDWTGIFVKAGFPVTIGPGGSIAITITFTPTQTGQLTDTLLVTTDLGSTVYQVPLSGIGVLLNPIAIISSNTRQQLVAGFDGVNVFCKQMDPSNYNTERASTLVFNNSLWQSIGLEKQLNRLYFMYENLGVCIATFTITVWRQQLNSGAGGYDVKTATVTFGDASADGSDRTQYVDIQATGEIAVLTITRAANAGPMSITALTPEFIKRGQKVENV